MPCKLIETILNYIYLDYLIIEEDPTLEDLIELLDYSSYLCLDELTLVIYFCQFLDRLEIYG
jgi:hypothetical protein